MLRWAVRFRVSIKSKLDTLSFGIMNVVAIRLGPDDVKSTGRAGAKASVDGDTQFRPWLKPAIETVVADEWFGVEEDIPDYRERIVINWASITQQTGHRSVQNLSGIVEAERSLGEIEVLLCGLP